MKTKAIITIEHDDVANELHAKCDFIPTLKKNGKQPHVAALVAMEAMKTIAAQTNKKEGA